MTGIRTGDENTEAGDIHIKANQCARYRKCVDNIKAGDEHIGKEDIQIKAD